MIRMTAVKLKGVIALEDAMGRNDSPQFLAAKDALRGAITKSVYDAVNAFDINGVDVGALKVVAIETTGLQFQVYLDVDIEVPNEV